MLNRIEAFEVQYWYFELLELLRCLKVDGQIEHCTPFQGVCTSELCGFIHQPLAGSWPSLVKVGLA